MASRARLASGLPVERSKGLGKSKLDKHRPEIEALLGRKEKLTLHQQDQVRYMLKKCQSIRTNARHFNVGVATIDRIKRTTQLS